MSDTYEDDPRRRRKGDRDDSPSPPPAFYEPVTYRAGCVDGRALDAADLRRLFDGLLLLSDHLRWTVVRRRADGSQEAESRATRTLQEREVVWRATNGEPTQAKVCGALSALAAKHDITLFPAFRAMPAALRHSVASFLDARTAGAFARTSQASRALVHAAAPDGGFAFLDAVRPAHQWPARRRPGDDPLDMGTRYDWPLATLTPTLADGKTTPEIATAYRLLGALATVAERRLRAPGVQYSTVCEMAVCVYDADPDDAALAWYHEHKFGAMAIAGTANVEFHVRDGYAPGAAVPAFSPTEHIRNGNFAPRDAQALATSAGHLAPYDYVSPRAAMGRTETDLQRAAALTMAWARTGTTLEEALHALASLLGTVAPRRTVVIVVDGNFLTHLGTAAAHAWLPPAMLRDLAAHSAARDAARATDLPEVAKAMLMAVDGALLKPEIDEYLRRGYPPDLARDMAYALATRRPDPDRDPDHGPPPPKPARYVRAEVVIEFARQIVRGHDPAERGSAHIPHVYRLAGA